MLYRIFDKILNRYYTNKIIEKITDFIESRFLVDILFKKNKEYIGLYGKKLEYNDYTEIIKFDREDVFDILVNFNEVIEFLYEEIKEYGEGICDRK